MSNPYTIDDLFLTDLPEAIDLPELADTPAEQGVFNDGVSSQVLASGDIISILQQKAGVIFNGKTGFNNTETGYRLGLDTSDTLIKFYIGNTTKYLNWTGTDLVINGYVVTSKGTFGGDGSDGALTITSGTTTVSASSATTVIKNYTSISITGTGKLAFSTPATTGTIIFLRSSGAVTLTSSTVPMIDASGMGSAGGAGGSGSVNNSTINGTAGTNTIAWAYGTIKAGSGGTSSSGTGGTTPTFGYYTTIADILLQKYHFAFCGAGGGGASIASGGSASGTGGSGGIGGGGLIIECAGAWNFTTASGISVAGILGTNGTRSSGFIACCGGGGGGGGFFLGLYNTLTANSGTITVSGGVGGNNNLVSFSGNAAAYGGGGGGSNIAGSDGTVGSGSAGDTTGGGGANGYSLVTQNILYA